MEEKNTNWDISELYKKSWHIVKNNKILWLFGMALAGAGSGSGTSNSNFDSKDIDSLKSIFQNNSGTTTDAVTKTLGAATTNLDTTFSNIFFAVPIWMYVLLALGFLLLILTAIILGIIYQAWVQGSLIGGVSQADSNQKPTISSCSSAVFPAIKGLIWVQLVPPILFFLAAIAVFGVLSFSILLFPSFSKAIPILAMVMAVFAFFVAWLFLTLTQIWATRSVVIDKKPASKAFFDSYKVVKKKFWNMLGLGIVNIVLSILIMIIMVIPIILVVGVGVFGVILGASNPPVIITLVTVGGILLLLFILGSMILSGILNSFKSATWTLAYKHIKGGSGE
ncbi:MAG: hypothetical protein WCV81_05850 [Microgenomates group bacterium]|jgi:hypothetical protein